MGDTTTAQAHRNPWKWLKSNKVRKLSQIFRADSSLIFIIHRIFCSAIVEVFMQIYAIQD